MRACLRSYCQIDGLMMLLIVLIGVCDTPVSKIVPLSFSALCRSLLSWLRTFLRSAMYCQKQSEWEMGNVCKWLYLLSPSVPVRNFGYRSWQSHQSSRRLHGCLAPIELSPWSVQLLWLHCIPNNRIPLCPHAVVLAGTGCLCHHGILCLLAAPGCHGYMTMKYVVMVTELPWVHLEYLSLAQETPSSLQHPSCAIWNILVTMATEITWTYTHDDQGLWGSCAVVNTWLVNDTRLVKSRLVIVTKNRMY